MRTDTEITYSLIDVTAADDAALDTLDRQEFSDLSDLLEEEKKQGKYSTLEKGQFLLDGTFEAFPDRPNGRVHGLWSQSMSDEHGAFAAPPELTATFSQNHSSVGITLRFYELTGDYADEVEVVWYGAGGAELQRTVVRPDRISYFVDCPVEDYYKITVRFLHTNRPYRYVKLCGIIFGAVTKFEGGDLISAEVLEETNPISEELRISTLNFSFYNSTGRFELLSPTGVYKMLQQQQQVEVAEIVDGRRIEFGTYYLETPSSETDGMTALSCVDLLGIIDKTNYMGGIYSEVEASVLIADIMRSAGAEYELDSALAGEKLSGYIPICTHREALQQVAFALGAIVTGGRSGKIVIRLPETEPDGAIGPERKITGQQIGLEELVTRVEVTAYEYVVSKDEREVYRGELPDGETVIHFSAPVKDFSINANILEWGANYARVSPNLSSEVVATGTVYEAYATVAGAAEISPLPAGAKPNILTVEGATLIDKTRAQAAAERILDYYSGRYTYNGRILGAEETAGQYLEIKNSGGKSVAGRIESISYDLTGGHLATLKLRGKAVDAAERRI